MRYPYSLNTTPYDHLANFTVLHGARHIFEEHGDEPFPGHLAVGVPAVLIERDEFVDQRRGLRRQRDGDRGGRGGDLGFIGITGIFVSISSPVTVEIPTASPTGSRRAFAPR